MKKISTLFLGLVIALSAVAAPQFHKREAGKQMPNLEQLAKKHIAKAPAQVNGETISIEANNLSIDDSYNAMMIAFAGYGYVSVSGYNDDWSVSASLYPTTLDYYTSYSSAAEDIELTVYDAEENPIALTVSAAQLQSTEKGDKFTATGVDGDGNTYNIILTLFAPDEPKATINIDFGPAAEVEHYPSYGDYLFYGERPDYIMVLDIYTDDLEGTYTIKDLDLSYSGLASIVGTDTTSVPGFFSVDIAIVLEAGVYNISADMFGMDSVLYHITMTYAKPVAQDTIEHIFVEPVKIQNFGGDFYFVAEDEEYLLVMDYYSDTKAGEFALEDLYTKYVALYAIEGTDTTAVKYEDVNLKVVENEEGYDVEVAWLGSDLHCYLLHLTSLKPVPTDTVQVNLEDAQHEDLGMYASYYGFTHYVLAANADSSLVIALAVKNTNLIGKIEFSDLYLENCGVKADGEFSMLEDAEFTASLDEEGIYTLEGWLFAENGVVYEFVIKTAKPVEAVENTNAAVKAEKVLRNGQLFIIKNGVEYNALGTIVK